MKTILQRSLLVMTAAAALIQSGLSCAQAGYPDKAVRLVVPFSAGGTADVLARLLSEEMYKSWNRPAVVVNKDGADTILGVDMAAKSQADAHTILIGSAAMAINTGLGRQLPYDLKKDLEPVTLALVQPLVLVASPNGQISSIPELIRVAKAEPGRLRYGSLGAGGIPNMSMELLKVSAGISLTQVPYKGSPAALIDVMSGQIEMMFSGITSVTQHVKTGRLRGVGITSKTRSPLLPDVAAIAEAGFPDYQATSWYGALVRQGSPRASVAKLGEELRRILALPGVRQKIAEQGGEVVHTSPEQFGRFLDDEVKKWGTVARVQKITVQ